MQIWLKNLRKLREGRIELKRMNIQLVIQELIKLQS